MKKWLCLFLSTLMLLGLTACGGDKNVSSTKSAESKSSSASTGSEKTSSNTTTETPASNTGAEKSSLSITFRDDGIGPDGSAWKWFEEAKATYNKDNVEINIAPIQASEGDYFAKIMLQLNSDNPPDIVTEDTFQLPNDVSAGFLTNLNEYIKDFPEWQEGLFYDSMINGVSVDGNVYAIPYNTDTRGLWYNKDIFEAAGLPREWAPKNWEEIFTALHKIKEAKPDIIPFWCNSGVATGEATSMQTYEMLLYATGARLMDEAGEKWVIKSENILKALKFIDRIYKEELGPPLSKVLNGQASATSAREYLPQGKLAVSLDGSWIQGNYQSTGASPWDGYENILGFAAFPTDEGQDPKTMTLAGGWGLAIPENSKNKDEAFAFIKHCMTEEVYKPAVIRMGSITTRKDIAESKEYSEIPFMQTATDFLKTAEFRPQNELYSSVSTCIQEMVESVASGTATPEQAMEKYAVDVTRTVGDDKVVEVK